MSRRVGLGVDFKYRERYPEGLPGICARHGDRLSHLSIVGVPSVEAAAWVRGLLPALPTLHHLSNIAPADPEGPDLARLALQDAISGALDAPWCGEDIGIWSLGPYEIPYFAPPLFVPEVAQSVGEAIRVVSERCTVPFLAEVPSCSFVMGTMDLGAFFHQLVAVARCPVVLDVSHVFSYALFTGQAPLDVLRALPLAHVWELHVAGGRISAAHPYRYIDSHSDAVMDEVYDLLNAALHLCENLKAITYEIGVRLDPDTLAHDLAQIERVADKHGFVPSFP